MTSIPPLIKQVTVPAPPADAFRRFTAEFGSWWPLKTHSVFEGKAVHAEIEPRVGGRIFERNGDGRESDWGEVTIWEPVTRVAFTWHPGDESGTAGLVELRFEAVGNGTRLTLTHTGWERFGTVAMKVRGGYDFGWGYVLAVYEGRKWAPVIVITNLLTPLMRPFQKRFAAKVKAAQREVARSAVE